MDFFKLQNKNHREAKYTEDNCCFSFHLNRNQFLKFIQFRHKRNSSEVPKCWYDSQANATDSHWFFFESGPMWKMQILRFNKKLHFLLDGAETTIIFSQWISPQGSYWCCGHLNSNDVNLRKPAVSQLCPDHMNSHQSSGLWADTETTLGTQHTGAIQRGKRGQMAQLE